MRGKIVRFEQLLNQFQIQILAIGDKDVGTWWNYQQVKSSYHRLYMMTTGTAEIKCDGEIHVLGPNSLALLPAGTVFDLHCPQQHHEFYLSFNLPIGQQYDLFEFLGTKPQFLSQQNHLLPYFQRLCQLFPEHQLKILNPYLQLKGEIQPTSPDDLIEADAMEAEALLKLLIAPFLISNYESTRLIPDHILKVKLYIDKHWSDIISQSELVAMACLSPVSLSRQFHSAVGMTIGRYITSTRIAQSKNLLLGTEYLIKDVARRSGFGSASSYIRIFKRLTGKTPNEFRRQYGR